MEKTTKMESSLQSKIIKYLKENGCYVVKVVTATRAGVPDILACYNGMFIGIEAKLNPKDITELQKYNIDKIKEAGGVALCISNMEQVYRLMLELNKVVSCTPFKDAKSDQK